MSQYKYAEIADTVYFWFAANATTGAAGDGATPLYDVRKAGDTSSAAPTASGTPTLLSHANYTDGLHEIAIDTTGYAAGEYAVFCTLTISTVNPAGFCGSFKLRTAGTAALPTDVVAISGNATAADNCQLMFDGTGYAGGTTKLGVNAVQVSSNTTAADTLQLFAEALDQATGQLDSGSFATGTLAAEADIADAVWNEARSGHVAAGSFGEGVASVQGAVTGAVGSVTGAVGSVTGNVGGNVTGSVGSVATGGITAASIATGAIDADALAADAVTEIWAGSTAPAASAIADAVWDEALSGHSTAGSAGLALSTASSGGVDPSVLADAIWDEALSGHATAGTAGKALSDVLVDTAEIGTAGAGLTTLATAANLSTVAGYLDTEVAAILAAVDTEVGAIKAKTDNLPAAPAATGDIPSAATVADAVWDEARSGHVAAGSFGEGAASVQGNVTGSVGSVSGAVGSVTGAVGSVTAGVTLATDAISASALSAAAVDEILDEQIGDGTVTVRQALRVLIAGMAGKVSGAATTTVTIRNLADSANVIVATVTADGDRSAVTVTP